MTEREPPFPVAGVIPSAGASRRMGRPKALLELDGRSFVRWSVAALREGGCASVTVVVAAGDRTVAAEAGRAGARVLVNAEPGEGPITSLRLAVAELPGPVAAIAYLPVDHPLVRPDTVAHLLAEAAEAGAALTLPVYGAKRGHPAIFARAVFAELLDPSLEGGARTVVHRHLGRARIVAVDDPGVVTDIDTPDAYAAALESRISDARTR